MNQDWTIQHRAERCAISGEPFRDGDYFYTLLYDERGEFRREDLSEAAFKARNENIQPFSFWRSKFEVPVAVPETLGKQTAEDLLRRYMAEHSPEHSNARYILAVMLEREKTAERNRGEAERGRLAGAHLRTHQNWRSLHRARSGAPHGSDRGGADAGGGAARVRRDFRFFLKRAQDASSLPAAVPETLPSAHCPRSRSPSSPPASSSSRPPRGRGRA